MDSYLSTLGAYSSVMDAGSDFLRDAIRLAEDVDGTLGITDIGRLVITLNSPFDFAPTVANSDAVVNFPWCAVEPGTDTVLVFAP